MTTAMLRVARGKKRLLIVIVLLFPLMMLFSFFVLKHYVPLQVSLLLYPPIAFRGDEKHAFIVATSGCRIPYVDPFDPIVLPMIQPVSMAEVQQLCGGKLRPLVRMTAPHRVEVDESLLDDYGVRNRDNLKCSATAILNDVNGVKIDDYYYASGSRDFNGTVLDVVEDHIRVQCHNDGRLVYTDFFAAIQVRPDVEERCDGLFAKTAPAAADDVDRLSVLILTLDSVSRVNVHRHMPRTLGFLRDTMGAFEMFGYNKLGDNTYPIIVSFLMGLTEAQVRSRCYSRSNKLSGCPFIWREFARHGYRTAFGEDSHIIASFHSTGKPGFRVQPTDYYLRPTIKAEYESVPRVLWNTKDYICFGSRVQMPLLMNFTRDFAAVMRGRPYFGYFHTSGLTHDDMNWSQLVDPVVLEFLEEAHQQRYLNNTVFILMSDHGARFGPIRETYIGKMEESLPALFIAFPRWFRQKHPEAMRVLSVNTRRLVSSFDIHETLVDILHGRYERGADESSSASSADAAAALPSRMSLFEEIPEQRTCESADIPDHYCTCQAVEHVSNGSTEALLAASGLVDRVNELTAGARRLCATFSLDHIPRIYASRPTAAFSISPKDKQRKMAAPIVDYSVIVAVRPGHARFDGTVRFQGDALVKVLGDVSRIDRYGTTSACVDDAVLRKFCWCRGARPTVAASA